MRKDDLGDDLLNVAEVSEILRITERSVRRAIKFGTIACIRIRPGGGRGVLRIRRSVIDALLEAGEVPARGATEVLA